MSRYGLPDFMRQQSPPIPIQQPRRQETPFISEGVKKKLTVQELRQMCKEYNESVMITGYSKATRKVIKQKLKEKNVL